MRRRERLDPAAEHDLAVIEAALAGRAGDPDGAPLAAEDAELAELATLLVAERPQPTPAFRAALDAHAAERFADERPRSAAATRARPAPRRRRPLIPAFAATLAVALVALVVVLGQGGGSPGGSDFTSSSGGSAASDAAAPSESAPQRDVAPESAASAPAPAPGSAPALGSGTAGGSGAATPAQGARKVEQSSTIELGAPADRVDDVAQDVLGVVSRHGGIVDQSSVSTAGDAGEARFQLRIPAARLPDALAQLSRLPDAKVLARTDDTLDVNQAYVSVRRQLTSAEAERRGLLRALANADGEDEAARVRGKLDGVERTIAVLERNQRALDRRVDFSRIALTVRAQESNDPAPAFSPGRALDDAGRVLAVTGGVVVIAAAALVPLALLLACAWPIGRALRRRRREQALDAA